MRASRKRRSRRRHPIAAIERSWSAGTGSQTCSGLLVTLPRCSIPEMEEEEGSGAQVGRAGHADAWRKIRIRANNQSNEPSGTVIKTNLTSAREGVFPPASLQLPTCAPGFFLLYVLEDPVS